MENSDKNLIKLSIEKIKSIIKEGYAYIEIDDQKRIVTKNDFIVKNSEIEASIKTDKNIDIYVNIKKLNFQS